MFKIVLFALLPYVGLAQNGKIRGQVIDESGEPLFSANVYIKGTTNGTTTDFDGLYEVSASGGVYDVEFSFIGYSSVTVTGITITAGEVQVMDVMKLMPATNELGTVTVTASQLRNTEGAVLVAKKNASNVLDGISAQSFRKIGDSDAATAVTRVPGVSVQGGKYVYVRGLGDRYTKTQLQGLDIPGLDPDRNSLQMDIFPTKIIENIMVLKTFTADLPADFVGGLVNIDLKEFPTKPSLVVSAGVGFTPGMHFNSDYLTQQSSQTQFMGFDAGKNNRNDPQNMSADNPNPIKFPTAANPEVTQQTQSFLPELAAANGMSFMNYNLGVSGGNQYKRDDKVYGFNAAFSYKSSTDFYENMEQNFWIKNRSDASQTELQADRLINGNLGVQNVYVTTMLGGAMKVNNSKYNVNLMHLQNGEAKAGYFHDQYFISNSTDIYRDNLEYSQRSISNLYISGEHNYDQGKWNVEWALSPTYSKIEDKDIRNTPYAFDPSDSSFSIDPSEAAAPQRIWRSLNEYNLVGKVDVNREHQLFDKKAKLKLGAAYSYKNRNYEILNYNLEVRKSGQLSYTGDANELLSDSLVWTATKDKGTYMYGDYKPSNSYSGTQSNIALYLSEEFRFTTRLKAIVGLRMEKYDQFYTGQNQNGSDVYENEKVLDLIDFFPTASVIFEANEKTNFRFSYFQTTARPSFKEKSTVEIADPLTGTTFIGNINLIETDVKNFDLRYEVFFKRNQTISVSGFYKNFQNPIELVSYTSDPGSFQPRNVGDANLLGVEIEARLNFGTLNGGWDEFSLNTNVSFVDSRVRYDRTPGGEYDGKENGLRAGEKLTDYRNMQGQAPYVVNVGVAYSGKENGIETGLYYNVQGRKLAVVGINYNPDLYTVPFQSLNLNFNKKFGKKNQLVAGLGVNNILNAKVQVVTDSYQAAEQIFSSYNPGTTFSLSLKYSLK